MTQNEKNSLPNQETSANAADNHSLSTHEFDILKLESQLCFPLYACARKVVGLYTPYLKPLGLTYTQYIVFLVLWDNDNITVGDICKSLYLDSGTLTPVLKKMEKNGYLTRVRSDKDERIVYIRLTKLGYDMRQPIKEVREKIGECITLPEKEVSSLYSLLYKTLDNI